MRTKDISLTVTCPQCEKIFQTTRQRILNATLTGLSFCSKACSSKYKFLRGINKPPIKKAKPENDIVLPCSYCGKPCHRKPSEIHNHIKYGPFCDHICYGKWRSENLAGENSSCWKGGYTLDYGGSHWKRQRNNARKRDNYTCKDCGITEQSWGYKLDVHHIIPYDTFEDPEIANRLENLVTLCRNCHAKRHKEIIASHSR